MQNTAGKEFLPVSFGHGFQGARPFGDSGKHRDYSIRDETRDLAERTFPWVTIERN